MNNLRYCAFISYSRTDKPFAKKLHRALEAYKIPKGIEFPHQVNGGIGRIFIDEDEMSASPDLGASLRGAIQDSECLIVVCSPAAYNSKWVNEEIKYFRQWHKEPKIFAVIVDGIPNATTSSELECFPANLLIRDGIDRHAVLEPLGIDVRKDRFTKVVIKLISGIGNVPFDHIWNRYQKLRTTRYAVISTIFLLVIAFLASNYIRVLQAENIQLSSTALQLSRESQQAADEGNAIQAIKLAYQANLSANALKMGLKVPEAAAALIRSMGSLNWDLLKQYDNSISAIELVGENNLLVRVGGKDFSLFNYINGQEIATYKDVDAYHISKDGKTLIVNRVDDNFFEIDGEIYHAATIEAVSTITGEIISAVNFRTSEWDPFNLTFSPTGEKIVTRFLGSPRKLGIFDWIDFKSDEIHPIFEISIPSLGDEAYPRSDFVDEEALVVHWFDSEQKVNMGFWSSSEPFLNMKVTPDSSPNCPFVDNNYLDDNNDNSEFIFIDDGRSIVSVTRPTAGLEVCEESWMLPDFSQLPERIMEGTNERVIRLNKEWLFNSTGFANSIIDSSGTELLLEGCASEPNNLVGPITNSGFRFDFNDDFAACISGYEGNTLNAYAPLSSANTIYLGTETQAINSIAYDTDENWLFSAGMDGALKKWTLPGAQSSVDQQSEPVKLFTGNKQVAVLYQDNTIIVYDEGGMSLTGPIPINISGSAEIVEVMFVADGKNLIVFEAFNTYYFVDNDIYFNQAVLIDIAQEKELATIPNIKFTGFEYALPGLVKFDEKLERGLFVTIQGSLVEMNLINGEEIDSISIDDESIIDAAFDSDELAWFISSTDHEDILENKITLHKQSSSGAETALLSIQAISAKFFDIERNNKTVAVFDTSFQSSGKHTVMLLEEGKYSSLPDLTSEPSAVVWNGPGQKVLFLSPSSPIISYDFQSGLTDTISANLESSTIVLGLIKDPRGRAYINASTGYMNIVNLTDTELCPNLDDKNSSSIAMSPDGSYLATSEEYGSVTVIYDLESCTPIFKQTKDSFSNVDMIFPSKDKMWTISDGKINVVSLSTDLDELMKEARNIVNKF